MKIGVVSDTHDHEEAVEVALRSLRERQVALVLHCGDIVHPKTVRLFRGMPTHFVLGNNDGERLPRVQRRGQPRRDYSRLRQAIAEAGATLHEPYGDLELAGRKIAWLHGDDEGLKRELELMDHYDFLFYGHTHKPEAHRVGRTLVCNPGALYRAAVLQCAVVDLATGEIEPVVLEEAEEE